MDMKKIMSVSMLFIVLLSIPTYALQISSIVVTTGADGAQITFTTDEDASGIVQYSIDNSLSSSQGSGGIQKEHTIILRDLLPNTQYNYRVSAVSGTQEVNSPVQSFRTRSSNDELFVQVTNINAYVLPQQPIIVESIPFALIEVYVNDVIRGTTSANTFGIASFTRITFPIGDSVLRVVARNPETNQEIEEIRSVIVDITPPELTVEPHPVLLGSDYLELNVTVSEFATVTTFMKRSNEESFRQLEVDEFEGNRLVSLRLEEGSIDIRVVAQDPAGNQAIYEETVFVDTVPVRIISNNLRQLSPSFSRGVTITGTVNKPDVEVRAYVNENSDFDCGDEPCPEDADRGGQVFTTFADRSGEFSLPIRLQGYDTTFFGGIVNVRDPNRIPTVDDTVLLEGELRAGFPNTVRLTAIDRVGNKAQDVTGTIHYATCGQGFGDFTIIVDELFPASVNPDALLAGVAQIQFRVLGLYHGFGEAVITDTYITPRNPERGVYGTNQITTSDLIDRSRCTFYPRSGWTDETWAICNLNVPGNFPNKTAAYEAFNENGEITLNLDINVAYFIQEESGSIRTQTHVSCVEVGVLIDKEMMSKALPTGLLNSTVNTLDRVVDRIDDILGPIRDVKLATILACGATYVGSFFGSFGRELQCTTAGLAYNTPNRNQLTQFLNGCGTNCDSSEINRICAGFNGEKVDECERCAESIMSYMHMDYVQRMVCDRVLCPQTPSAQQYIKDVTERSRFNMYPRSACVNDQTKNQEYFDTTTFNGFTGENLNRGCAVEYKNTWGPSCIGMNVISESQRVWQGQDAPQNAMQSLSASLSKLRFCSQTNTNNTVDFFSEGGTSYVNTRGSGGTPDCWQLASRVEFGEGTVTDRNLISIGTSDAGVRRQTIAGARDDSGCVIRAPDGSMRVQPLEQITSPNSQGGRVDGAVPMRYHPEHVESIEVNGQSVGVTKFGNYGVDVDGNVYNVSSNELLQGDALNNAGFARVYQCGAGSPTYSTTGGSNCVAMTAPPELAPQPLQAFIADPADSFIDAVRCICLPAIEGWLIKIRNILSAISNCFKSVLYTGSFKAGACEATLSRYLCDLIFAAIRCAPDAISAFSSRSTDTGERNIATTMRALRDAGTSTADATRDRYGSTASYRALITDGQLLKGLCLAAFGYDFMPDLEGAFSIQSGGFSIGTDIIITRSERTFSSFDANNVGQATFLYQIGYMINAGSDITYQVRLVCSNDNSCDPRDGYDSQACDCVFFEGGSDDTSRLVDSGTARGGTLVGDGDGKGNIMQIVSAPVRFDKVCITYTDRTASRDTQRQSEEVCRRISEPLSGQRPSSCSFSMVSMRFFCNLGVDANYGTIHFVEPKLNITSEHEDDDTGAIRPQELNLIIWTKHSFENIPSSDQLPKFVSVNIFRHHDDTLLGLIPPRQISLESTAGGISSTSLNLDLNTLGARLLPADAQAKQRGNAICDPIINNLADGQLTIRLEIMLHDTDATDGVSRARMSPRANPRPFVFEGQPQVITRLITINCP